MKFLKRVIAAILCTVLFAVTFAACGSNSKSAGTVTLNVTQDFGSKSIFSKAVNFKKNESVMTLLQKNLKVETAYGGSFINSINGVSSQFTGKSSSGQKKADWFYFVNGIAANAGANDYIVKPGDVIWWDFHSWDGASFTPAVIGCYPQPFTGGYNGNNPGTVILAGKGYEDLADKLSSGLKKAGVKQISTKPYDEKLLNNPDCMYIVLEDWKSIENSKYWSGIEKSRKKIGWFAELGSDKLSALDEKGDIKSSYTSSTGAVLCTAKGMGDTKPVWLITGIDKVGVEHAVNTVVDNPDKLSSRLGIIIDGDNVVALPAD